MLSVTALPRQFEAKVNGETVTLTDPDKNMSPEAVLNFYSNTYPALTTAKIEGPEIKDDKVQYKFSSVLGTKG